MYKSLRSIVKALLLTAMALVLYAAGLVVCMAAYLPSQRLSALVSDMAAKSIDADIAVGNVDLSLRHSYPFLTIEVDSIAVLPRCVTSLSDAQRSRMPVWTDTLAKIDRLRGGFDIWKALKGEIVISDLTVTGPEVNLLVWGDIDNFSILKTKTATSSFDISKVRIHRFSIKDPGPIRYVDIDNDVRVTAALRVFDVGASSPADRQPRYGLTFDSNIDYPLLEKYGLGPDIPIALNGDIEWHKADRSTIVLSDFSYAISKVKGMINASFDITDDFTVNDMQLEINPISIKWLSSVLPDSIGGTRMPKDFTTDAEVSVKVWLKGPYNLHRDVLPYVQISLLIPECRLNWRKLAIDRLALDTEMTIKGLNLNESVITINSLRMQGKDIDIDVSGSVSDLLDDPCYEGDINGTMNLSPLSAQLFPALPGSLSGTIDASLHLRGSQSMIDRSDFHNLRADGSLRGEALKFVADDTLSMYYARTLNIDFGNGADNVLHTVANIDSVRMLHSNLAITLRKLLLDVAAYGALSDADTTAVIPLGGRLKAESFSLTSLSDTAGISLRDISGPITMQRYKGNPRLPLIKLNARLSEIVAGTEDINIITDPGSLRLSLGKRAVADPDMADYRSLRHTTRSLRATHPKLSVDSVYILALRIHNLNHRLGHHRIHPQLTPDSTEIINWGTSDILASLLLDWDIQGSLSAPGGRLRAEDLPGNNTIRNIAVDFCNDSVTFTNMAINLGHSDMAISGCFKNLKRGFTAYQRGEPVKAHISILSDSFDINEIAGAVLARSDRKSAVHHPGGHAPLLIPQNIEADINISATDVRYSHLRLSDFSGSLLMYDGALNLHDLRATSSMGMVDANALYSAPSADDMNFGIGMRVADFNIADFLTLVPAVDSLMPMLSHMAGTLNADIAATAEIAPDMDVKMPSLRASVNISGDSLRLTDGKVYHEMMRWLMLKADEGCVIPHLAAEATVSDNCVRLFPFIFDFNRYRLGVEGYYDLGSGFKYHIAVLKSPLPFRFGINISGTPKHHKIRFGGAHFSDGNIAKEVTIAANKRISLTQEFEDVFRRGISTAHFRPLEVATPPPMSDAATPLAPNDSITLINHGLIPE